MILIIFLFFFFITWGTSLCIALTPFLTNSEPGKFTLDDTKSKGFILLYSGGMDSYALLNICRNEIEKVAHFIINPHASKLALNVLAYKVPNVEVYLFDHREFLQRVKRVLKDIDIEEATCLACKRAMLLKVSEYGIPVMGDSLGQVASQTLQNMAFITRGLRVVRPLVGSDKEDIEPFVDNQLVRYIGSLECPFKPRSVLTSPKEEDEVEFIVRKLLKYVKLLGVRSAREIAEMG